MIKGVSVGSVVGGDTSLVISGPMFPTPEKKDHMDIDRYNTINQHSHVPCTCIPHDPGDRI